MAASALVVQMRMEKSASKSSCIPERCQDLTFRSVDAEFDCYTPRRADSMPSIRREKEGLGGG